MQRRQFLSAAAISAAAGALAPKVDATSTQAGPAVARYADSEPPMSPAVAKINPPGVRTAGIRMIPVVGGKYKVWTKRIGSGPIKVLLLHGGPGFSHEYLEAMESFLPQAGIEMYYYDQLGCNNSDHPDDPSLWTLSRYVEEVEEVRVGLGLDKFVLYGHSCGGVWALEYALKYPQHLRGLVISNMTASMDDYLKRTAAIKLELPPATLKHLRELEAKEAYDSPEYQKIMMDDLYPKMLCRLNPWPESVDRAFRHANEAIYAQMQGKSEFLVTGNLKGWTCWERLPQIRTRALTIGSRYDEMDPADMKKMATLMPNASYAYCPNGSHLALWDDQESYFKQLLAFLRTV